MSEKTIIEISEPLVKAEKKFFAALTVLQKATGINITIEPASEKREVTPYTALQDLSDQVSKAVETSLHSMYAQIINKWFSQDLQKAHDDFELYTLKGRYFFNPKSGRFITKGDWRKIIAELDRMFGRLYSNTEEALAMRALALGKILNSMPEEKRLDTPLSEIVFEPFKQSDKYKNTLEMTEAHTAELIQNITAKSRKAIAETIIDAYRNHKSTRELQKELYDKFSSLNKDFMAIAITETSFNFNNGKAISEIEDNKPGETIFMVGQSSAFACPWCRDNVNNKVVVLVENPLDGDTTIVDGKEYPAIWPGKNNYGRKRSEWSQAMLIHPWCRCSWTRNNPKFFKFQADVQKKLEDLQNGIKR